MQYNWQCLCFIEGLCPRMIDDSDCSHSFSWKLGQKQHYWYRKLLMMDNVHSFFRARVEQFGKRHQQHQCYPLGIGIMDKVIDPHTCHLVSKNSTLAAKKT